MKILKHGDRRPRKFACPICGCEFVADTREYCAYEYDGQIIWWFADCPECDARTNQSEPWENEGGTKEMKFTLVRPESGDWEALYINGKLIKDGHSLSAWQILECIKDNLVCDIEEIEISDEAAELGMPVLLSELGVE